MEAFWTWHYNGIFWETEAFWANFLMEPNKELKHFEPDTGRRSFSGKGIQEKHKCYLLGQPT